MENKELLENQIGLFFKQDFQGSFEEASLLLKKVLGKEAGTQILPIPSNAPSEFPRLVLNIPGIVVNFAKNRVDIFVSYKDHQDDIHKIIEILINNLNISIGRVGFVASYFSKGEVATLKNLFLPEKIEKLNVKEIGVRVNVGIKIGAYVCNNIQNIQNGEIKKGSESKRGIILGRDINTITEDLQNNNFDFISLINFIKTANAETEKMIII